jgi:hypothetical protein
VRDKALESEGVAWLEPIIGLSRADHAVIVAAVSGVNSLLLLLATFPPCGDSKGSAVCGSGLEPPLAALLGVPIVIVELAVFLLTARHFARLRIGTSPEGLVLRKPSGDSIVPWQLVALPSRIPAGGFVTVKVIPAQRHRGNVRHIRLPASMAYLILTYRKQFAR